MSDWKDIGEQLRAARECKELKLEDVSQATRIPAATLSALEESDYSIFPNPTYARSFLTQYSEYLGVDAQDWVKSFETGDVLVQNPESRFTQSAPTQQQADTPPPINRSALLQTLTVIIITLGLILGGFYLYKKLDASLGDDPVEQKN
ncbi:MAG: helix-turn-helix domain-containing protein [Akkermansiaceae bacterium]